MKYHKCCKTILGVIMSLCITACGFGNKSKLGSIEEAQDIFINNVQTMSERDALSNEIDYYSPPRIIVKRKIKELTGRDAIHECNIMIKENEEVRKEMESGKRQFGYYWDVYEVKEYAISQPDEIVGAVYYFEGEFTHYANGYHTKKANVLCINGHWYVKQVWR